MEIENSILSFHRNHLERLDSSFCNYLRHGLCTHHAGLTDYERVIAESLFRRGNIRLLAATSTLSAGVNLNVDVVVIDGLSRCKVYYSSTEYKQMIGRTGRMGQSKQGRVYVLLDRNDEDQFKLIHNSQQILASNRNEQQRYLRNEEYWEKAIIELIANDLAIQPNYILQQLYQFSLYSVFLSSSSSVQFFHIRFDEKPPGTIQCVVTDEVRQQNNPLLMTLCNCFLRLVEEGFIMLLVPVEKEINEVKEEDVEIELTELGDAVFSGNVSIRDVITIATNLTQLNNTLDISNTFQILYQLTPLTIEIKISIDKVLLYIESHLSESDVSYINRDIVPISILYSLRNGSGYDVHFFCLFDSVGVVTGH